MIAAFELSPDAIAVFDGPDLICRAANAALRRLVQRDVVGRPLRESMVDLYGQELVAGCNRVLQTGEPLDLHEFRFEVGVPDGEPRELLVDLTLTPWPADEGPPRGVVARAMEVTDQVRRRRAAEQQVAAEHRLFLDASAMVIELQDALLPKSLPLVPGVEVAARYLLAQDGTSAGGDWFDAVVRPDGRLALVVGDVVGHGVEASATMSQLRAVLRSGLAGHTAPLSTVMGELDRAARGDARARAATVCVVELEPRTGVAHYVTAGHPAPLVLGEAGAQFLPSTQHPPLGTSPSSYDGSSATLGQGDVLLLYTDGILERPGTPPEAATVDLARVALGAVRRPTSRAEPVADRVCQRTLEVLTRQTGYTDDITLLAAHVVPQPAPLDVHHPAHPASAGKVRTEVAQWLTGLDVRDLDAFAVQHAVGEAVANVIDHAYDDPATAGADDAIRVQAVLGRSGRMSWTVADHGSWTPPGPYGEVASRGRGLALAAQLTDDFTVQPGSPCGTTVSFTVTPGRPATMLATAPASPVQPLPGSDPFRASVVEGTDAAGTVVRLQGGLDAVAADDLDSLLTRTDFGGARHDVVVDLAGLTYLGSRGVQVLHDHAGVSLVAPTGSVAQQVLDLVRLDYRESLT